MNHRRAFQHTCMTPLTPPPGSADTIPACGYADVSARGRIRFDGRDAAAFLHALVSNDVAGLARGTGCYAVYLTPQGRMIADLRIYHRGDHLLLDCAPGTAAGLAARFDSLVFAEDVRVKDVTAEGAVIRVVGAEAADRIAPALGVTAPALAGAAVHDQCDIDEGFTVRTDDAIVPSFDVWVDAAWKERVVLAMAAAGAASLAPALVEALRIEAGRPLFGVDMTAETIPLEAGLLDRAISMTKGCYVGQEVIVRVLHRGGGRVAKRLVKLRFDPALTGVPAAGTVIGIDGRETGRITSAAWSPISGCIVALGYVRREDAEAGVRVAVGDASAEIVGLAG